ncbi:MAG: N-acyl homoserine lactonase family protein [Acidimicrobiales bacterium]
MPNIRPRRMRLWALRCGGERVPASLLDPRAGARGRPVFLPYFLYVIDSPAGIVLFDCGAHADFALPGSARHETTGSSQIIVGATDGLGSVLARIDLSPAAVDVVVLSHLHYDHCGGLAQLPSAEVYVGRGELEFATAPTADQRDAYSTADFGSVAPERWKLADEEHDLFGDGSLVIVPTPGHTPGHIALLVRLPHQTLLLAGDAAYEREAIRRRRLPGFLFDAASVVSSWQKLEELERSEGAEIILTHEVQPDAKLGPAEYYD